MKAKLLTVLSLIVVCALIVGPVLALSPSDSTSTVTPMQPSVQSEAAPREDLSAPAVSAVQPVPKISGPFVSEAIVPGSFDGDLRDLPQRPSSRASGQPFWDEIPNRDTVRATSSGPDVMGPDPVAQHVMGSGDMPTPITTFEGLSNQDNFALLGGRVNPPDTNGAVGPNHYIQTVNLAFGIWDKSGARLAGPTKISAVFAAAATGTVCDTNDNGDPIVIYDSGADRWILSQFAFASSTVPPFFECIAISKGPNPVTDGWWTYAIRVDDNFPDYPKLSVWPDAYYWTARMFAGTRPFFLAAYALDRASMLAGRPMRYVRFELPGIYDAPLTTNWRGEAPPAGTPALLALADDVTDSIITWQFKVNWDNPASSTLSPEYPVAVAPFAEACPGTRDCIPFTGAIYTPTASANLLDDLSPRLMFNLEYRRVGNTESVWANHTITESGRTVVRWYELRYARSGSVITPTVYQQGSYAPTDNVWRWMASLAADKDNNMAIGYSASAPDIDPQIRYTGRLVTDTLGTLGQGEITMTVGTGHPTNANSRWGDYSAMTVDPVDDCTFWYTQEYYTTTTGIAGDNRPWTTRIGSFKYPSCTPVAATGAITGLVYDATTLAPIPRIPVTAFDATNNRLYAGATNASGIYTLTVLPGTYTIMGGPLASIGYPVAGSVPGVVVTSALTSTANIPLNGAPYLIAGSRIYSDSVVGNGNGYPEPGEKQVGVYMVLTNTGVTTATSIVATLTSLTPGFNVVTPTASYPDIAAGSMATNTTPFGISLDVGLACGAVGNFRQVVVTAQGTYTNSFTLRLGIPPTYTCTFPIPNLSIASTSYTESSGDGYLQAGESVTLNVTLSNTGLTNIGPATNVVGQLTALTPGFTLTVDSANYPDIPANGTGTNLTPFKFTIAPDLLCGAALNFGMRITTTEGVFTDTFQLVTGQPALTPTLVLTDDVEAGVGAWITSTNISGSGFAITTESAHSPTHSWTDSPGTPYPNGLNTSLTSPVFDFTTFNTVEVKFWHTYATEAGFDYGLVEYSIDGGTTWKTAAAYDGTQATWTQATVNLSEAAHESNVRIRFRFTADTGVNADGWHIDDIQIGGQEYGCPALQPGIVNVVAVPSTLPVGQVSTVTATVTTSSSLPLAGVPVYFTTNRFNAVMSGLYETPPNLSAGTGVLSFWYNPATMQLTYSGAVSGLGSNVTAAHIHTGTLGVPGGVLTPLSYITTTNGAIFSGTVTLNATSEALLYNGGLYANVHTSGFPGGEVRGQILEGTFSSILTGDQQVPPVTTAGKGAVYFTFNPGTGLFDYMGQVSGLSSNVTAAHIHTGTVGSNGGVIVPLSYTTVTNGAVFSGSLTLSSMAALLANFPNGLYVNVHTTNHPGGEVRGQLMVGLYVVTDQNGQASIPVTSNVPGPVIVTAIAGNARGSTTVTFGEPPVANFTASTLNAAISQTITFTNTTTGTEPISYLWDFGDGVTSTLTNPTHAYVQAGTYTVTLTASNAFGSASASLVIMVKLVNQIDVVAAPSNLFIGRLATITATVTNILSASVAGVPVTFTTGLYYAHLAGLNETPPVTTTSGTGHLDFTYNPATKQLSYSGSVSGLSGAITAAHIHRGAAGIPGPVAYPLSYSGTVFSGVVVLSPADEALLLSGGLYANVHTAVHPGGEIRGQILDHALTAILSGANETPPVVSNGTGTLNFTFDPMTNRLTYSGSVSGLNANVTAAHIHTGTVGVAGTVLYPLSYITTTNGAIFSGVVTVTQSEVNALLTSGLYANVHTASSPAGEIRGQIKVGWLGVTNSQGQAVTHFTTNTPGAVTVYAFADAIFGQVSLVFQDLLRIYLPLISR